MSYIDEYRRRMQAMAGYKSDEIDSDKTVTLREALINKSAWSQREKFLASPTLITVLYDGTPTPSIRSDKYKDIEIQTFLFEPNKDVKIGTLIEDGDYIYLATTKNGEKIYPELVAKLCNDTFDIPMGYEEHVTYDRFGNPIVRQIPKIETIPAVISDKDYSTAGNAIMPLPSGRINIELQYKPEHLEFFGVNYNFKHSGGQYQVTDVREIRITPDEKFIKVSAQRVTTKEVD